MLSPSSYLPLSIPSARRSVSFCLFNVRCLSCEAAALDKSGQARRAGADRAAEHGLHGGACRGTGYCAPDRQTTQTSLFLNLLGGWFEGHRPGARNAGAERRQRLFRVSATDMLEGLKGLTTLLLQAAWFSRTALAASMDPCKSSRARWPFGK